MRKSKTRSPRGRIVWKKGDVTVIPLAAQQIPQRRGKRLVKKDGKPIGG